MPSLRGWRREEHKYKPFNLPLSSEGGSIKRFIKGGSYERTSDFIQHRNGQGSA